MRLDLCAIGESLQAVEDDWPRIDADLARTGIGGKDPFTAFLRGNMLSAYAYLDDLLQQQVEPFSNNGLAALLGLNNRVHYGTDRALMDEYKLAIAANADKFYANIGPVKAWYTKHARRGDHPYKLAAETYVSILGQPQLFIEGNHRAGALIASWISLDAGYAPFVLSVDNAIAYFAPSAQIKRFADRSTWRGRAHLPKYRKSFREFWEHHVEVKYLVAGAAN